MPDVVLRGTGRPHIGPAQRDDERDGDGSPIAMGTLQPPGIQSPGYIEFRWGRVGHMPALPPPISPGATPTDAPPSSVEAPATLAPASTPPFGSDRAVAPVTAPLHSEATYREAANHPYGRPRVVTLLLEDALEFTLAREGRPAPESGVGSFEDLLPGRRTRALLESGQRAWFSGQDGLFGGIAPLELASRLFGAQSLLEGNFNWERTERRMQLIASLVDQHRGLIPPETLRFVVQRHIHDYAHGRVNFNALQLSNELHSIARISRLFTSGERSTILHSWIVEEGRSTPRHDFARHLEHVADQIEGSAPGRIGELPREIFSRVTNEMFLLSRRSPSTPRALGTGVHPVDTLGVRPAVPSEGIAEGRLGLGTEPPPAVTPTVTPAPISSVPTSPGLLSRVRTVLAHPVEVPERGAVIGTSAGLSLLRAFTHGTLDAEHVRRALPNVPFTPLNLGTLFGATWSYRPRDLDRLGWVGRTVVPLAHDTVNTTLEMGGLRLMDRAATITMRNTRGLRLLAPGGGATLMTAGFRDLPGIGGAFHRGPALWRNVGRLPAASTALSVLGGYHAGDRLVMNPRGDIIGASDGDIWRAVTGAVGEGAAGGTIAGPVGTVSGAIGGGAGLLIRSFQLRSEVRRAGHSTTRRAGVIETLRLAERGFLRPDADPDNADLPAEAHDVFREYGAQAFVLELRRTGLLQGDESLTMAQVDQIRGHMLNINFHHVSGSRRTAAFEGIRSILPRFQDDGRIAHHQGYVENAESAMDSVIAETRRIYQRAYRVTIDPGATETAAPVSTHDLDALDAEFTRETSDMPVEQRMEWIRRRMPGIERILAYRDAEGDTVGRNYLAMHAPAISELVEREVCRPAEELGRFQAYLLSEEDYVEGFGTPPLRLLPTEYHAMWRGIVLGNTVPESEREDLSRVIAYTRDQLRPLEEIIDRVQRGEAVSVARLPSHLRERWNRHWSGEELLPSSEVGRLLDIIGRRRDNEPESADEVMRSRADLRFQPEGREFGRLDPGARLIATMAGSPRHLLHAGGAERRALIPLGVVDGRMTFGMPYADGLLVFRREGEQIQCRFVERPEALTSELGRALIAATPAPDGRPGFEGAVTAPPVAALGREMIAGLRGGAWHDASRFFAENGREPERLAEFLGREITLLDSEREGAAAVHEAFGMIFAGWSGELRRDLLPGESIDVDALAADCSREFLTLNATGAGRLTSFRGRGEQSLFELFQRELHGRIELARRENGGRITQGILRSAASEAATLTRMIAFDNLPH